jgi:hypothetical protein
LLAEAWTWRGRSTVRSGESIQRPGDLAAFPACATDPVGAFPVVPIDVAGMDATGKGGDLRMVSAFAWIDPENRPLRVHLSNRVDVFRYWAF